MIALGMVCTSCAPSATSGSFSDPAPGAKLYAIDEAMRTKNMAAIPELIECLGSDDELVRFNATMALQRLTGETLGYHFDDPWPLRREAILRWQAWSKERTAAVGA